MLRLSQIALPLEADEGALAGLIARRLAIAPERIRDVRVVRRALDARHKPRLLRSVTVDFTADDEETLLSFLDSLSLSEQRAALIHLSMKWAELEGKKNDGH